MVYIIVLQQHNRPTPCSGFFCGLNNVMSTEKNSERRNAKTGMPVISSRGGARAGDFWMMRFVFDDRIHINNQKDRYYSYILTLRNNDFYIKYKQMCLNNEKKFTPNIAINNIIVCSNRSEFNEYRDSLPPLPSSEATTDTAVHN